MGLINSLWHTKSTWKNEVERGGDWNGIGSKPIACMLCLPIIIIIIIKSLWKFNECYTDQKVNSWCF